MGIRNKNNIRIGKRDFIFSQTSSSAGSLYYQARWAAFAESSAGLAAEGRAAGIAEAPENRALLGVETLAGIPRILLEALLAFS